MLSSLAMLRSARDTSGRPIARLHHPPCDRTGSEAGLIARSESDFYRKARCLASESGWRGGVRMGLHRGWSAEGSYIFVLADKD
ncbi:hypothetical protein K227x_16100 [Rubripirellula lacrimiformis]|uniref:Uncharacterized protein n=1 Tax=Rubripirellula lacrimiformis TaxID=1930273 RepID=A0A517N8A5_9BACT|nr:hypothetical protein [Rubripirellula lacrimiformis]QDT03228.1 hypothetical protein K227x_16100 [Rubripirellula lacrimiformis]